MRLRLNHKWRPRPFRSFLGCMDLKTGVTLSVLFALLNKVAGVYGLIAVFTGGSLAQLSLYVYSIGALVAFAWGLNAVSSEDKKKTLYFAHMFLLDHLVSTTWTVFFGVRWWVYNPHDGRRQANSKAQQQLMQLANVTQPLNDAELAQAAMQIWNKEKGFAMAVLIIGWLVKIYFAALIYSYAWHLRQGTYRSLPLTLASQPSIYRRNGLHAQFDSETTSLHEDEHDDFSALRTPNFHKYFPNAEDVVADEVLFDEDERAHGFHSRLGTSEESASASSGGADADEAAATAKR
ncbi:DUF1753-domain-containing protein [Auricularia subglabra TFB-10046 SS5]|nr:DUF1753-domain-containing protein [Auricularia subglabra TFB-10046 SS5]